MRNAVALLVLLVHALAGGPTQGQNKKARPAKPDPQASFEPRSKPGQGQKFLEKFVGDWEVAKSFYPRSGPPFRQKGECRQTMIHGGRFLQSDFTFSRGDEKTTGMGLVGFESATGVFTSVWTDSRSTRMSFRQGKDRFDGKQIVLYGRLLGVDGKKGRVSRTVTRLEEEGRKIVHRQYSVEEGGKERLVMELVLTRKAKTSGK
jgi:hypothetical protein